MIVKVCEKHEVELWAGEECEICALRTRVAELERERDDARKIRDEHFTEIKRARSIIDELKLIKMDWDAAWHQLGMDDYDGEDGLDLFIDQLQRRAESAESRVEALQKAHENLKRIASKFAARVQERCPSWFTEEPHSTDFAEADHELRAALAPDAEKEG